MAEIETRIEEAVARHESYILENLSTLTMKQFRGVLEAEMGLEPKSLRDHRDLVDSLVDKLVLGHQKKAKKKPKIEEAEKGVLQQSNGTPATKKHVKKPSATEKKQKGSKAKETGSGEKRSRKDDKSSEKPKKRQKAESKPTAAAGGKSYGKAVDKLKDICKRAGINIPTVIYKRKQDVDIADGISALLEKHGLDRRSGKGEIASVRAKIQKEKDLEGIDLENIVEGGRRSRRGATVNYAQIYKGPDLGSDEDEEDEGTPEPDDDSDVEMDSEDDAPGSAMPKSKGKHKPDADTRNEDEDAENESDSKGEESEQDEEIDDKEKESDDNSSDQPEVNGHSNNSSQSGKMSNSKKGSAAKSEPKEQSDAEDNNHEIAKPSRKMPDWSDSE